MEYTVVFDVTTAGYRQWWIFPFSLAFIIPGILLILNRHRIQPQIMRFFLFVWLGAFLLIFSAVLPHTLSDHRNLASALREGRCQVVEGVVTNFDPMPESGHKYESFVVAGQRFSYSDYIATAGFNNARSRGGPINNGIHVRICHVGNEIARLEIAR